MSLIALVITIIVIILSTIAFNGSTSTICKANYAKFISNLNDVEEAIQSKSVTVRGFALAKERNLTDAQVYNYIAKGGNTDEDYLTAAEAPDYTVIEETADVWIDLSEIKVNTLTQTGVNVRYAVTKDGTVFIWPPYSCEGKYNIRDGVMVDSSLLDVEGKIDIKVSNKDIKIKINAEGVLENI